MRILEAWRQSRIPYTEVAYRSVQASRGAGQTLGTQQGASLNRLFKMVMRSAKISKVAFAIFGTFGAAIPFLDFVVTPGPESLVSAISLSLAISLAYIVFYSLQVLPSFSNAEPFTLLAALPLEEREFSLVALFSFIRTFDYLALGSGVLQVLSVFALTGSILSTILMGVAIVINVIFASALALWFSGIFYRNVSKGGRSKKASLGRIIFLITWGFGALSIAFLFDLVSYVLPYLNNIVGANVSGLGSLILLLHPFPQSVLISSIVYPSLLSARTVPVSIVTRLLIYFASFAYIPLAFFVARRTGASISKIARGKDTKILRRTASDYELKLNSPLKAQVMKDVRLASKNPSVAFLFALPFFVVFILGIITTQFSTMRASAMIASTLVGCSFAVMICSTLLSTETVGIEYTLSLPLKTSQIVKAKALLSTLTFAPVPLTLLAIALSRVLTSSLILLIPFVELPPMYAACVIQVSFYMGNLSFREEALGKSKGFSPMAGGDLKRLIQSLALSVFVLMLPMMGYAFVFIETKSQLVGLVIMAVTALLELAISVRIASQSRAFGENSKTVEPYLESKLSPRI